MNRVVRKIQLIFIISMICYGILIFTPLGTFLYTYLSDYYNFSILYIGDSVFYNGILEYISNKDNSWNILTATLTTFIAVVSLIFLYSRIRKQEKLLKETITSNASNRYRDAISLLDSENDAVVTGAIYLLDKLAREQPKEYAELVRNLLCGFLRNETIKRESNENRFPDKFQTMLNCLFRKGNIFKDFVYSDINSAADLSKTNLSYADLSNSDLSHVSLKEADLQYVNFEKASLAYVKFFKTKLDGANFNKSFLILTECIDCDLREVLNLEKSSRLETVKFGDSQPDYIIEILKKIEDERIDNKISDTIKKFFTNLSIKLKMKR